MMWFGSASDRGDSADSSPQKHQKPRGDDGPILPVHAVINPPAPAATVGPSALKSAQRSPRPDSGRTGGRFRRKGKRRAAVSPKIAFEDPAEHDDAPTVDKVKAWGWKVFHSSTRYATNSFQLEGSDASASNAASTMSAQRHAEEEDLKEKWSVERTIVDWDADARPARDTNSSGGANTTTGTASNTNTAAGGSRPSSPNGSVRSGRRGHHAGSAGSRRTGQTGQTGGVHFSNSSVANDVVRRIRHAVWGFFDPRFEDDEEEEAFQKMNWQGSKKLAFIASLYLVLDWVLYLIFNRSETTYEKFAFYLGMTIVTLPIPFLICLDPPFRFPKLWGPILIIATWYPAMLEVIQTYQCHFFSKTDNTCRGKDFLYLSFYATALPTLMLFVCASRFWTTLAMLIFFVLECALVLPVQGIYVRNVVSFVVFSAFILYLHYSRELSERRMFKLNMQLKIAYRGQQRALASESKANLAKRRFASYVFHEVRVPLNNALLAYQNLQASNALVKDEKGEDTIEAYALESSLQQMAQILNDVLDFHRMDAGGFESFPQPFCLHRSVRSMLAPVAVSTQAKDLTLKIELDPSFDDVYIVGDEVRLRQVLSNLCSNALKFTPKSAGAIRVTVRWADAPIEGSEATVVGEKDQEQEVTKIVRFEVADRGPGIKPSELLGGRLFQPFVQTKVGKLNGKGTGLGLAIVRQIVALSGGRLGVSSRRDEGCIFWFELPYPLADRHQTDQARQSESVARQSDGIVNEKAAVAAQVTIADLEKAVVLEEIRVDSNDDIVMLPALAAPSPPMLSPPPFLPGSSTSSSIPLLSTTSSRSSSIPRIIHSPASQPSVVADDRPKLRVLCVDDDQMTRTLLTRMLTKCGCIIETADDGRQLVEKVMATAADRHDLSDGKSPPYDLIIGDNQMPYLTGEDAVRQLRDEGRTEFFVGCTGNALVEDQAAYRNAGADDVVTKPVMLKDLKTVLETARRKRDKDLAQPPATS